MNLFEFITKYKREVEKREEFEKDFKALLKQCKKENSLVLCFHTLLENRIPFEYLKEVIEYDEKAKEDIFNHDDTFKWSCAFGQPYLLMYLNDKVKNHNIPGSVNATFINYRLDNLKVLEVLGHEKQIYTEPNFCQAISRADQVGCGLNIVEYFLNNIDKFKPFSKYVFNELKQKDWMSKICQNEHTATLKYLLDNQIEHFQEKLLNYTDDIMTMVLYNNKFKLLDIVMQSYVKDNFIISYGKIKNKHIKDNLSLDKNNHLQDIIENYPELLKHDDIKLYMMNYESLGMYKFITEKRKITSNEIKKSYLDLSEDKICFEKLCKVTPKFKIVNMKIGEVIKIVNNVYAANQDNEEGIDYNYDGQYMSFNRANLLNHKDFKNYIDAIGDNIDDQKMFNILKKEQMKKDFEIKYPEKTKVKSLKI